MSWFEDEMKKREKKKLRRNGLKWFLAGILIAVLLIIALAFIPFSEEGGIKVVRIEGTIVSGNSYGGGYIGSEYIGSRIREAADNPLVDGIVLRVNSPGGSPAGAQEIIQDIEYAKTKKPVVVSMGDIATSAAYHISAHSDLIYANPDTMTGSVGTIWTFYDISGSLEKEGVNVSVVKSGEQKDIGSEYRSMTTEERDYVQDIVDESFELFIEDVMKQRNITRSDIEEAQIVRGAKAIELGLVDRTGNLYAAMEGARELSRGRGSIKADLS